MVVATKFSRAMGEDPNQQGTSRRWIMRAVEGSLLRLQTDYIDIYQIHRLDPDTDVEETLSALTDLVRSGKVRAIGSSTTPASNIVEAQWLAERRSLHRFRVQQPPYSILNRAIETEVLPKLERYGMGAIVWGPLGQGMLTGRVRKGQQTDVVRAGLMKVFSDAKRLDAVEQLISLAEEVGLPMTHLAMAFAVAHPAVTSALLGNSHHGAARRPARRHGRRAQRRHPRSDRRDRPAGHRGGHPRPGLRATGNPKDRTTPPTDKPALRFVRAPHA